jgi:hypothetical protein
LDLKVPLLLLLFLLLLLLLFHLGHPLVYPQDDLLYNPFPLDHPFLLYHPFVHPYQYLLLLLLLGDRILQLLRDLAAVLAVLVVSVVLVVLVVLVLRKLFPLHISRLQTLLLAFLGKS